MKYQKIKPPKELAHYVQFFWILEENLTCDFPFVHRALAESCPELIFYFKGQFDILSTNEKTDKTFLSGIFGQSQQYRTFETKADFGILGVYLFPYSIPELFGLPANELSNQYLDIQDLCGKEGKFLEEKVMLATNNRNRINLISDFLVARLQKPKSEYRNIITSIWKIITTKDSISIPLLATESNLSRRQFERKFIEHSGFSPKSYLNIVRFNSILNENSAKNKSLTQIAYDFGFYDQSHFIQDFKKFSGFCPSEYFNKNDGLEYRATREV